MQPAMRRLFVDAFLACVSAVDLCQVGLHISEHSLMQFNMSTGESDVLCPLPDANSQGRIHAVTQVVASVRTHSALVFTEPSVSQVRSSPQSGRTRLLSSQSPPSPR